VELRLRLFLRSLTGITLLYNYAITIFSNGGSVFIIGPYNRQFFHKSQVQIQMIVKPCMVSLRTLEPNTVHPRPQQASANFYNSSEVLVFLLSFQFKIIYLWT